MICSATRNAHFLYLGIQLSGVRAVWFDGEAYFTAHQLVRDIFA